MTKAVEKMMTLLFDGYHEKPTFQTRIEFLRH